MKVTRLYASEIVNGLTGDASQVSAELDNLVTGINANDDAIIDRYTKEEVDSKLNNLGTTATVLAGTSFPTGTFTSGQLFWRTDLLKMFSYDSVSVSWKPVVPDSIPLTDTQILNQIKNVDGKGSGLNSDYLQDYEPGDFQKSYKAYGNATYTDSLGAGATLTKTIPLGGNYNFGKVIVSGVNGGGIIALFGTDSTKTLVSGSGGQGGGSAWSRRNVGYIVASGSPVSSSAYGYNATGGSYVGINDIYISGTNLIIVFKNGDSTNAHPIGCNIDWEVW